MTDTTYQLKNKVKDDLFSIDNLSQYNLSFWISEHGFKIGIFDTKIDRCLMFEEYDLGTVAKISDLTGVLEAIIREHEFLQAGYWNKICVVVVNMKFTFVPEGYHHPGYNATFLSMNCEVDTENSWLFSTLHRSQQMVCIFSLSKYLAGWVRNLYPEREVAFHHNASAFVEGLLKTPDKLDARYLHLLVNKNVLTIAFFRNGNLQFVNSFQYSSHADFVYYVSFVMDELGINPEELTALLWGNTGQEPAFVTLLEDYIAKVKTASRPRGLNFGYRFDDIEEYDAFELFSSYHFTK